MSDEALKRLFTWVPECVDLKAVSKAQHGSLVMYEKGDETAPFFTEAYLYNLLGKEDARTLMALLKQCLKIDELKIRRMQMERARK